MIISDDEFDSAASKVAASASKDPVDAAAAQVVQGQRTQLRSTLYNSLLENPDMAARAQTLGRQAGIPADVVSRNMPEVQRNVQLDEFDKVLENSPTVATWLTEQNNAKIAHDDVDNLGAIDIALKFVKNTGSAAKSGLLGASAGVVGVVRAPVDLFSPLLDPLAGTVLPENPLRRVGAGLAQYQGNIQAQADAAMPKAEGVIGSGYYSGIGSLSRNVASLPLLFLPGGQKAALTGMVAPVAGQEYGEAREKGLGVVPALTYGTSQAAIEYATEKLPISRLMGDLKAGSSFAKTLGRQLAVEIPGEQLATVLQDLNEFAVLRPEATFADYLAERPDAAVQTLVATIVGVGGQTTIVKGIDSALNRFTERESLAQDAEQTAQGIDQLNQLAAASKVLQRDPETFQAFVAQASAESDVQDVFIDARIFNQSAQDAGLTMEQLPPSVQAQLTEALQTGGDLRIPVAEYTAMIAPTEYAQGLLDHLKTNPQGMSRAEAQVFMQSQGEELQAEVERVLTEKVQDDAFKASAEAVKAGFVEQLNAAGRFAPDVNTNYATVLSNFYAVTAAKIGMTPEQMAKRYPLQVQVTAADGDSQYDQGSQRFTEDNRLSNLNPNGASWQRIRESNPVLRDLAPDDEITVYRATIGDEVRPDDFVAVDKSTLRKELKNVRERDGATAKIVEKRVKVRDLLMANDATEFVYFPDGQQFNQGPRGQVSFEDDITQAASVITLFKGADLSTFLHEAGHFFLEVQLDLASRIEGEAATFGPETNMPGEVEIIRDSQALLNWFGVESLDEWHNMPFERKSVYHEQFARGFEAYLFEGKAPSIEMQGIFQRFRAWMINVYRDLVNLDVELTPEVRGVMDRMIATTEQIELAEAGRSMMPLFTSPEQAGMNTEEFAAYQALGVEASQDAIQDLQARTLRDMAWMKNAQGREIKKLQKQAEGLRAEMSMEARREIMSQPVYRAWQFLTGKATRGAESRTRTTGGAPVETVPPVLIGVDGNLLSEGGQVFKSHHGAKEAKKLQANTRVVKVDGGWALAEKTEAQLAAEAKAAKRLSIGSTGPKGMPEAAHAFIASKGGLSKSEMADTGFDRNVRVGSKWLFAGDGKGMTIGQASEALQQEGYLAEDDINAAYELIKRSVTDPQYTPEGFERIAEIESEAMTADEMPGLGLDIEVTTVGKFDMTALKSMDLPEQIVQIMVDLGMTDTSGIHPDIVADSFEFESGDDLVRTLAIAESPKDAIEALTDQKMLENYGELASPEAIERAADVAIHNATRARFVAAELNAVNKAAGKPKVLATAAREFAAKMIDRLQIKNIKPNQYAAAEARAAKASTQAMRQGDTAAAATEKRNQLINTYATKAAYDALAEVQKIRKFFGTVTKGNNKKLVERGRDPDVVNAARAILSAYGVAPSLEKGAQEYMGVLERNDPAMYGVLRPSVDAALANAKPFEQLTMEELRGLNDEIAAMWHLSKRSRQMEIDGNLLDMDDLAEELGQRIAEIGIPDTIPGETGAITKAEAAKQSLQFAGAVLRRVEQWAETKDGTFGGPFLRFVFQPVKTAADRYRADRARYRKAFLNLVEGVAPSMKQGTIAAPELGYTFGKGHNGVGMAELLHAVLHTGNESNKRKLLLGRGWATENPDGTLNTARWDTFIERMQLQKRLTKEHYDFAQGVWDLLEDMKPLAQKTHRDVFGRYFDEVTANEFETPFGTYRGGYVPAQADPRIVSDAAIRKLSEQENENMAYSFPSTAKGFTKGRVDYNRPLILDLRTLTQHMDKVLLFSHMEPAVRDVNKLLTRTDVSYGLTRIDPAAYEGLLIPWLNRSARQQVETPIVGDGRITRVLSVARNRAGMALMFGNISNTLQQITGFSSVLVKVKKSHMKRAVAEYIKSPKKMTDAVGEASIFMKDRMANEVAAIQNQMDEILLDPTLYEKAQAWTNKHAYFLQSAVDNIMSPMVWTGAYNQAITEGMSDLDAVKFADGVVRQTQGTTLPEDVSRIETGPAYARLFTQFIGYFNMLANTNATELQKVAGEVGMRKGAGRALGIVFYGLLAPAWIAEAIAIAMRGGPEDEDDDGYLDDWLGSVIGMGTLKTLLAGVPFVGQFINVGINKFNDNPMDDRVSLSPAISLIESTVSAPQSVYKALVEDGSVARAVKDVATAVSIATGLPAHWAGRPASYLTGIIEGDISPTGVGDFARGLVTGVASPESKE
jgi:hypothetical protein